MRVYTYYNQKRKEEKKIDMNVYEGDLRGRKQLP
jgi:hypothetical protein